MPSSENRLPLSGLIALLAIGGGCAGASRPESVLLGFASLFQFLLLAAAAAVLGWFLYSFFLRRILRARRIANARERRLMREALSREKRTPG
jgi:hypothetical protein